MDEPAVLNARQAIAKHVNWKIVLKTAIAMEEQLTEEQRTAIRHSQLCPIGRWLDSPGTLRMKSHQAYLDLAAHHVRFHREMSIIADLIAEERFQQAGASMGEGSGFSHSALALARAITAFNGVLEIAIPLNTF